MVDLLICASFALKQMQLCGCFNFSPLVCLSRSCIPELVLLHLPGDPGPALPGLLSCSRVLAPTLRRGTHRPEGQGGRAGWRRGHQQVCARAHTGDVRLRKKKKKLFLFVRQRLLFPGFAVILLPAKALQMTHISSQIGLDFSDYCACRYN